MRHHPKRAAIAILVEDKRWSANKAALRLIRRAANLALDHCTVRARCELAILLADDGKLKSLNRTFRGKAKATNVLSFPGSGQHLGDIALAYGVVSREARAQGKMFAAHAAHLAAHGVLHLLGYNHEKERDALLMEGVETEILARLGLGNPYAPKGKAA